MIHFLYRISSKSDDYACARARLLAWWWEQQQQQQEEEEDIFPISFFFSSRSDLHNLAFFSLRSTSCRLYNSSLSLSLSLCPSHNSLLYVYRYITALTFVTRTHKRSLMYMYVCYLEDCFFLKLYIYIYRAVCVCVCMQTRRAMK